nr:hypothetical protein GCM10025732_03840 [Glycomyces mayteni]
MSGTRLTLTSVTVTAPDPRALADFYARLLGVPVAVSEPPRAGEPAEAGWAQVRTGEGLTLNFEYEQHWQPPSGPPAPAAPTPPSTSTSTSTTSTPPSPTPPTKAPASPPTNPNPTSESSSTPPATPSACSFSALGHGQSDSIGGVAGSTLRVGGGVVVGVVVGVAVGLATVVVLWRLYRSGTRGGALGLMGVGAVATVVGAALVVAEPFGSGGAATVITVVGGPVVFLVGNSIAVRAETGRVSRSRIAAIIGLAVVALIGSVLPALVLAALAFAILLLLALGASGWFKPPSMSVED